MTLESSAFVVKQTFADRFEYVAKFRDLMVLPDDGTLDSCGRGSDVCLKDESHHETMIFPPVVLGLGFAKLRHKLSALLHQLRLELGNNLKVLRAYCGSVISICTDQGTEAGIFSVPGIDLHQHLINEANALSKACPVGILWALKDLTPNGNGNVQVQARGIGIDREPGGNEIDQLHHASALVCKLFPNCIYIPGVKHSMDNCLHDVWGSLQAKEGFLRQLSAIEYLMKQPMLRSKLAFVFFSEATPFDKTMSQLLKHWGPTLKSLRWHAVIDFLESLLKLEVGLRKKWNLARWMKSLPSDRKEEAGEGRVQPSISYKLMDQAVHSPYFWMYARMLLHISSTSETLSKWAEGCWLHDNKCTQKTCGFKGARAPELASGAHKFLLKRFQSSADFHLSRLSSVLPPKETHQLASDFHIASSRLSLEWELRLHFWDLLPWKLAGLAVPNVEMAQVNARQVLDMWQSMGKSQQQCSHPMTRRFLDPQWAGGMSCHCQVIESLAHIIVSYHIISQSQYL